MPTAVTGIISPSIRSLKPVCDLGSEPAWRFELNYKDSAGKTQSEEFLAKNFDEFNEKIDGLRESNPDGAFPSREKLNQVWQDKPELSELDCAPLVSSTFNPSKPFA